MNLKETQKQLNLKTIEILVELGADLLCIYVFTYPCICVYIHLCINVSMYLYHNFYVSTYLRIYVLHLSIYATHTQINLKTIELLVELGADLRIPAARGETPNLSKLDMAIQAGADLMWEASWGRVRRPDVDSEMGATRHGK